MDGATPDPGAAAPGVAGVERPVPPAGQPPGLLAALRDLLAELPGLVSDRVHLLSLELKRASRALAQMLALVVAAAVLSVTAWFALWAALAAAAIEAGMPWGWVAVIVLAVNLGAAALAIRLALKQARLLTLPATVRRLTVAPSRGEPAARGPAAAGAPLGGTAAPQPGAAP